MRAVEVENEDKGAEEDEIPVCEKTANENRAEELHNELENLIHDGSSEDEGKMHKKSSDSVLERYKEQLAVPELSAEEKEREAKAAEERAQREEEERKEAKKRKLEEQKKKKAEQKRKADSLLDAQLVDYSHIYKSFNHIFCGAHTEPKTFSLTHAMREQRNLYATFISLMDSNILF